MSPSRVEQCGAEKEILYSFLLPIAVFDTWEHTSLSRAEESKSDQIKADQSRAEQSGAGQGRRGRSRADRRRVGIEGEQSRNRSRAVSTVEYSEVTNSVNLNNCDRYWSIYEQYDMLWYRSIQIVYNSVTFSRMEEQLIFQLIKRSLRIWFLRQTLILAIKT